MCVYLCAQFNEGDFVLRTLEEHVKQCDLLDSDPQKSIEYGINFRSALMSLQYLNVCSVLVPDVMHDILEGVVQYELKLLIRHCGYFRARTLEHNMTAFELGYMEATSRPTPITSKTIQTKDNIQYYSFSVMGLRSLVSSNDVPEEDEHWKNYTPSLFSVWTFF